MPEIFPSDGLRPLYKFLFNGSYYVHLKKRWVWLYLLIMNLQENISRIKEMMELKPNERVYDYQEGRNTVSEKLPFDIDKLVDSGVVFVTPAIDGNPNSETYKEWLEEPYTHLISLHNVEHSSEDGWIQKAITKRASTEQWKDNFVDKLYDGKYNQILWSLEKLGINPMDMLIDTI